MSAQGFSAVLSNLLWQETWPFTSRFVLSEEQVFVSHNASHLKTGAQSKTCCLGCVCGQRMEAGTSRWQFSPTVLKWGELSSGFFFFLRWLSPIDQALTLRSQNTGEVNPTLRFCQAGAKPGDCLRQQPYSRGSLSSRNLFHWNKGYIF